EPGDPLAEAPLRLLGRAVELHVGDPLPCIVLPVWLAESPADADHVMSRLHQPRRQVRADVPASADYRDTHQVVPAASTMPPIMTRPALRYVTLLGSHHEPKTP